MSTRLALQLCRSFSVDSPLHLAVGPLEEVSGEKKEAREGTLLSARYELRRESST